VEREDVEQKKNRREFQANLCLCSELRLEKYLVRKFMRKSHSGFKLRSSEGNRSEGADNWLVAWGKCYYIYRKRYKATGDVRKNLIFF
jgi:hypothetical protein